MALGCRGAPSSAMKMVQDGRLAHGRGVWRMLLMNIRFQGELSNTGKC